MIDTNAIRKKILYLALQGKLTTQYDYDSSTEELYLNIQKEKLKLVKENKIKKQKDFSSIDDSEIPFEIPKNWKWVRVGQIFTLQAGKNKTASEIEEKAGNDKIYPCYGGNGLRGYVSESNVSGKHVLIGRQGALCGNVNFAENEFWATEHAVVVYQYATTNVDWAGFTLRALDLNQYATSVAQPGLAVGTIENVLIPLPPVEEQNRIADKIVTTFNVLNQIDEFQKAYSQDNEVLKSKLIDAGIQGKLTEQHPEDGQVEEVLEGNYIPDCDKILKIPSNWKWIRLGWVMEIERGGSPRPIKEFVTDLEDGINWIKIGDVEKDGKYILQTKEKIKPEGEKKSRRVYPGDFLLTNSMSFGRPYISKIEGCIHDGWLLLRNSKKVFDLDYLYWLLSSEYAYNQFAQKASGATVDNLNKDKVASAIIPLPPLAEQRRIAKRIEELIQLL